MFWSTHSLIVCIPERFFPFIDPLPFRIRSISVLYPFRSRSRTCSVSVLYPFAFPVRFLLSGNCIGNENNVTEKSFYWTWLVNPSLKAIIINYFHFVFVFKAWSIDGRVIMNDCFFDVQVFKQNWTLLTRIITSTFQIQYRSKVSWQSLEPRSSRLDPR